MTQEQLWNASVDSGLCNLTWDEFSGAVLTVGNHLGRNGETRDPYAGVGPYVVTPTGAVTQGLSLIPTTGSIVVLDFGRHIQLTEDYLAPGSLG
jgi:hypothetical protein